MGLNVHLNALVPPPGRVVRHAHTRTLLCVDANPTTQRMARNGADDVPTVTGTYEALQPPP